MTDCCGPRVVDASNATAVCTRCGDVQPYQDTDAAAEDHAHLRTSVRNRERYAYKRVTHFRLWLERLQGLDHVPRNVIDDVRRVVRQYPIKRADATRIRSVLKELGHTSYFNSIPAIRWQLYAIKPFRLDLEQRADIESMFYDIEDSFRRVRSDKRTNMLSYSFLLRRMLELLDIDACFDDIKELKHETKAREVSELWQDICTDLNFPFIESSK